MKLKLNHAKWCMAFVVFTISNFHITLMIMRYCDKAKVDIVSQRSPSVTREVAPSFDVDLEPGEKPAFETSYTVHHAKDVGDTAEMKSSLPSFANDESEFALGSLIEREFGTRNLYITTFLLCHFLLDPESKNGVEKSHPATINIWKRAMYNFRGISYEKNGERKPYPAFYCRIKNTAQSSAYIVKGSFVPNRLTSDSNANRRLDILRCPMDDTQYPINPLTSRDEIFVEVLREEISILNFTISWRLRKVGYMLSIPASASRLNPWSSWAPKMSEALTQMRSSIDSRTEKVVHICVPGTMKLPTKEVVPLYLEFVSHHLLLGASHIFLPVSVGWKSLHMQRYLQLFQSYIDEGKLTILSHSADGLDMTHSVAGLTWNRLTVKVIQVNMCLYEAKGVADYVLVLDIDEYFIPKHPHKKIIDVIQAAESPFPLRQHPESMKLEALATNWKGGRGWADGDGHPFCFLTISSDVFNNLKSFSQPNPFEPWMGQRFKHGAEPITSGAFKRLAYRKAIFPTRRIFQAGLSLGGACLQDPEWRGCSASGITTKNTSLSCVDPKEMRRMGVTRNGTLIDFRKDHAFYETVLDKDSKLINRHTEGVLYHFLLFHPDLQASAVALLNSSLYTSIFFSNVMDDLRSRNLHLVMLVPDSFTQDKTMEDQWPVLFSAEVTKNFNTLQERRGIYGTSVQINDSLPRNYSLGPLQEFVELPNFSRDYGEYALGAMIERVSDSYDLWLTTFFLCHWLLEPKEGLSAVGAEKVSPEVADLWKGFMVKAETTRYLENGEREQPPNFFCKITHVHGYEPYIVPGRFIPNKLTPDSNSNRRLDIFRCKMKNTRSAYRELANTSAIMMVEILRGDEFILGFHLPWITRRTGLMLRAPPHASNFDPWKGFDKTKPGVWSHDNIYMCVPGWETPPSKASLPLYLEFIQHHLLMGVDHIFLAALFSWESIHMTRLLRVLKSYIDENVVSIESAAGDDFDFVYSTAGLVWGRDNMKIFHVNMCTFFAKGVADYVGVWDFDEHFLPLGTNKNIMDVLRPLDPPQKIPYFHKRGISNDAALASWKSGPGLADMDGHPFCYFILNSAVTLHAERTPTYDLEHPWMAERFPHGMEPLGHGLGFKKSIRPTRKIFMGGLHLAGACRLETPWNGCAEPTDFCWASEIEKGTQYRLTKFDNGSAIHFNINHRFDEIVLDQDAKVIDPRTSAIINHIQYHRFWFGATASALESVSDYKNFFFPSVLSALDRRDLVVFMTMPEQGSKPFPLPDYKWLEFDEIRGDIEKSNTSLLLPTSATPASHNFGFETLLPAWGADKSELFLSSIVERASNSWDLFLTTFLLAHTMMQEDLAAFRGQKIRQDEVEDWKIAMAKFRELNMSASGQRLGPEYYCNIRNTESGSSYLAKGEFMPNRLTPDANVNERVDILRCKINNAEDAYMELARSKVESVFVEILREDSSHPTGLIRLISFSVSWATRCNGKSLWNPTHASMFDPWKGFDKGVPGVWSNDKIYMCVPGVDSFPSRKSLPILLEFIQHHLLMGIEHIFLTMPFSWESVHMRRIVNVLRSFIGDGRLSVNSHAMDNIDFLYSMLGASWHRDTFKIFQVNMCTYMMKGVVDYVGIWDVDEFFIPKGANKNILETIETMEGRNGFADVDQHPYCYVTLTSEVIANREPKPDVDMDHLWIGERFSHGLEPTESRTHKQFAFKKSIIPTRNIFQLGLSMHGACRLDSKWSGCDEGVDFCYKGLNPVRSLHDSSMRRDHYFDEVVSDNDTRTLNPHTEAVIYHFLAFRYYHAITNEKVLSFKNEYARKYFKPTVAALTKRNLDLFITIPDDVPLQPRADQKWYVYDVVYESRKFPGTLFPGGDLQGVNN